MADDSGSFVNERGVLVWRLAPYIRWALIRAGYIEGWKYGKVLSWLPPELPLIPSGDPVVSRALFPLLFGRSEAYNTFKYRRWGAIPWTWRHTDLPSSGVSMGDAALCMDHLRAS